MQRAIVRSGHIRSIGHDPSTNTLEVEFNNGRVYQYGNVNAKEHEQLVGADSIGSHFHTNIRNKKKTRRV